MIYTVKNWGEFQHYKDRSPPWIKLHKALLDNLEFQRLPIASRALAPMIWLIASEDLLGQVDCDLEKLAFRLRTTTDLISDGLTPLIENGFLIPCKRGASTKKAKSVQPAVPETEAEKIFAEFWRVWPKGPRKQSRGKCFELWQKQNLSPKSIVIFNHIELMKKTDGWKNGFVPAPDVYLRNERWDGAEVETGPEEKRMVI